MDQKTHFSFVLEGLEIILLTTSMPAQIKHQPLSLLRTPVCVPFPLLLAHTAEVKSTKNPTFHQHVSYLHSRWATLHFLGSNATLTLLEHYPKCKQLGALTRVPVSPFQPLGDLQSHQATQWEGWLRRCRGTAGTGQDVPVPPMVSGSARGSGRWQKPQCVLRDFSDGGFSNRRRQKPSAFTSLNDARGPPCSHVPACNRG